MWYIYFAISFVRDICDVFKELIYIDCSDHERTVHFIDIMIDKQT